MATFGEVDGAWYEGELMMSKGPIKDVAAPAITEVFRKLRRLILSMAVIF
jgi:hypothetical protein